MAIVQKDENGLIVKNRHSEYVKGLSGMTMVVPAQRILDTLDLKKLQEMRAIEVEIVLKSKHNIPDVECVPAPTDRSNG